MHIGRYSVRGIIAGLALSMMVACGSTHDAPDDGSASVAQADSSAAQTTPSAVEPSEPTGAPTSSQADEPYTWSYGDIVLDSESLSFFPVDIEAFVLDDGRVRIYSANINEQRIRTLTSEDGLSFTRDKVPTVEGNYPTVVRLPDGRFRMYYGVLDDSGLRNLSGDEFDEARAKALKIKSSISDDALNWTEEPGFRTAGIEPSAIVLPDGRTLLAVRRAVSLGRTANAWCGDNEASGIALAVSEDGLNFDEGTLVIDSTKDKRLMGRAHGVELGQLADGSVVMHYEGCLHGYFHAIDPTTLQLGTEELSHLRSTRISDHYDIPDLHGIGGDIALVVVDGEDRAYFSLRSVHDGTKHADKAAGIPGLRQRVALATRLQ